MPAFIDISGKRFGRLVVVGRGPNGASGRVSWSCRCDCGSNTVKAGNNLYSGNTRSCGCLSTEVKRAPKKHGHAHIHRRSAEYKIWMAMLHRCQDTDNPDYGGRGISVCDRWRDFSNFYADMGKRPRRTDTIERENNDGNYELRNCIWATRKTQSRNRRSNRIVEYRGRKMTLKEASEVAGLPYLPVWLRIVRRGWSVHRALTEPIR